MDGQCDVCGGEIESNLSGYYDLCGGCRDDELEDWCDECQGEGRVPTHDYESYSGAMYKPCPVCFGDLCEDQPDVS